MPFPLIPVAVGAGIALSAAVSTYFYWSGIKKKLFGKTMLIMGPRGCGKTTMAYLLENDELPTRTKETKVPGNSKAKKLDLSKLEIDVNLVHDMPGNNEARNSKWKPHFEKCDFGFFCVQTVQESIFLEAVKKCKT